MQTHNWYETLQEDQANGNAEKQVDPMKEKIQVEQQIEHNKENQGNETEKTPKKK